MYGKMNTKFVAALAVFAMLFAGFGAIFVAQANDAADPTGDVIVSIDACIPSEDDLVVIEALDGTVKYKAELIDDLEGAITVVNLKYYEALDEANLIEGDYVVFTAANLADSDVKNGIKAFTSAEFSKTGKLTGGVDTVITFANKVAEDVEYEIVDAEAASLAIVAAVAVVEASYADYMSPEEVQAAITAALANVSEYIYTQEDLDAALAVVPAGYISAADAKAEQDKAVADAVAAAIAGQPDVKKDDAFMYIAIVLAAVVIALAGLFIYVNIVKPKLAKKKAEQPQA